MVLPRREGSGHEQHRHQFNNGQLLKTKKQKCEAQTNFCSGELIKRYGVNGSEKEGKTFRICGACMVILKRGGAKFKDAFTLLELLCVIASISILASTLLPALASARRKGKIASCVNDHRQIGLALAVYGMDNGCYPLYMEGNYTNGVAAVDRGSYWDAKLELSPRLFACPGAPFSVETNWLFQVDGVWYPNRTTGYNGQGQTCQPYQTCGLNSFSRYRLSPLRVAAVVNPARMISTSDCDARALAYGYLYPEMLYFLTATERWHGITVSGWCDGHVDRSHLADLKDRPGDWNFDGVQR